MTTGAPIKHTAVKVDIQLLGRPYAVACEAGEEKRLETLAGYVDSKLRVLHGSLSSASQERLFMLTCLMLADEIFDLKAAKPAAGNIDEAALTALVEKLTERLNKITHKLEG